MGDDPIHKRVLRRCLPQLKEDLDFDSIIDNLTSKEVFQDTRIRDIREEKRTSDRIRVLIENIGKSDSSVYKIFLAGLKETKQDHLRKLLLEEEKKVTENDKTKTGQPKSGTAIGAAAGIGDNKNQASGPMKQMTGPSSRSTETVVRPKDKRQGLGNSTAEIITKNTSDSANERGNLMSGSNASVGIQPSGPTQILSQTRKETAIAQNDVTDAPSPQFDKILLPRNTKDSPTLDQENEANSSPRETTNEGDQTNSDLMRTPDSNNMQPPPSFGNLDSYVDMHRHTAAAVQEVAAVSKQEVHKVPEPALPSQSTTASSQPNNTTTIDTITSGIEASVISDDSNSLKTHFDVSVIYTQAYRNRADEVVQFVRSLSEGYSICYYDDEAHFGFFTPDKHPEVLCRHCVLHFIIISDNMDDDKNAKMIRADITMINKEHAQIRPVLFGKNESKYIPKSLANTKPIPWYDKDKEHVKDNLLALLKQCKDVRKKRENEGVQTAKDIQY